VPLKLACPCQTVARARRLQLRDALPHATAWPIVMISRLGGRILEIGAIITPTPMMCRLGNWTRVRVQSSWMLASLIRSLQRVSSDWAMLPKAPVVAASRLRARAFRSHRALQALRSAPRRAALPRPPAIARVRAGHTKPPVGRPAARLHPPSEFRAHHGRDGNAACG